MYFCYSENVFLVTETNSNLCPILQIKPTQKQCYKEDIQENRALLSENYGKLIDCIKHHQAIVSYVSCVFKLCHYLKKKYFKFK